MKNFRALMLTIAALTTIMGLGTTDASAAEKTLGLKGGYASYNEGGYIDVYFQYDVVNHVRLAPSIGYAFRDKGTSGVLFDIDVHFPFRVAKAIGIYPFVGPTLQSWHYKPNDASATRFGCDFGGGLEFYLTSNLKLTVEGKYSLMNDTSGGFVGMGMGYVF